MEMRRQLSRPVGVGHLMYVGDDCIDRPNQNAITMCKVGTGVAIAGLLLGKPKLRNIGAAVAVAGFLAI